MILFVLAIGIFNIFMSLVMKTENFVSSMVFKVIPFFLGAGAILYYFKEVGIL